MSGTRLRIAYGVMGMGAVTATRARSVLPALMAEHDVTSLPRDAVAGAVAARSGRQDSDAGYAYSHRGDLSVSGTVARNFSGMSTCVGDVEDFLVGCEGYRERMPSSLGNGRTEAVATLLGFIEELGAGLVAKGLKPCHRAVTRR